jgi:hypothetical protein
MTAVGQVAVSERGFGVGGRSAVERLKRRPAVLEFGAGVAARGLVVGMAEHVGDEREVAAVLADQSRGERVSESVRGLLDASRDTAAGRTPSARSRCGGALQRHRPRPGSRRLNSTTDGPTEPAW